MDNLVNISYCLIYLVNYTLGLKTIISINNRILIFFKYKNIYFYFIFTNLCNL